MKQLIAIMALALAGCQSEPPKKPEPNPEIFNWRTYDSSKQARFESRGVISAVEVKKRKEYEDSRRISDFIDQCNTCLRNSGHCHMDNVYLGDQVEFVRSYFELMGFEVKIELERDGGKVHDVTITVPQ